MKCKSLFLTVLILTSFVLAGVNLSGLVTDTDGNPLEGISVYLKSSTDMSLSDVTNENGEYAIVETGILVPSVGAQEQFSIAGNRLSLHYAVPTDLSVDLYATNGKRVARLFKGRMTSGVSTVDLNVSQVASGIYFLVFTENGLTRSIKQRIFDGDLAGIGHMQAELVFDAKSRNTVIDTLVFKGEGYKTVELPIVTYEKTYNQSLTDENVIVLPDSFTKNVLFEELTGLWCGYCPLGALKIKNNMEQYGDRFIGVAIHAGDVLEIPAGKKLAERYGGSGYPSCVVDRGAPIHPNSSDGQVSSALNSTASCGLAIDATQSGEVTITAGFLETISDDVRLTVYLLENKIPNSGDYKQKDYDGVIWSGYTNDHSLTAVLTSDVFGDPINADAGTTTTRTFTYDLSGTVQNKAENCTIVALLHITGASASGDTVLNALEVHVGEKKDFQ